MAGGGGAWKVAYADFVTAMMAFFMVMWLVGQKPQVKEAIAQHFSDPYGEHADADEHSDGVPPNGRGRHGKKHGEAAHIPSPSENPEDPATRTPRILTLHDNERTDVGAVLPFEIDSAELTEEGKIRLKEILPKLLGMPHKIEVRGHCSGRLPGPECPYRDAWQLSYARAVATLKFLESSGISAERIRLSQAGHYEPFTIAEDTHKQIRNERVEVYLLNEFAADLQGTKEERQQRFQELQTAASPKPH